MDYVVDTSVKLIIELLPYAWGAIKQFIWLNKEIEKARNGLRALQTDLSDVDNKLIEGGRRPLKAVEGWEEDVGKTIDNVAKLVEEFTRSFKCEKQDGCVGRCRNFWHGEKIKWHKLQSEEPNVWFGLIPYIWHRFKIVRHVYDCKSEVDELRQRFERFKGSYEGRRFPDLLHPGSYSEESFEKEMLQIQKWLMDKGVQVIGVRGRDGNCTASLLKIVHNNDQVRNFFNEMVFFMQASSSSMGDVETARENISKAIGLRAPVSKDKLYTHLKREKFRFLLLLNDLQDGLDLRWVGQMVTDIGLPSLKKKYFKIVFTCRSERVLAAMNAKETSIEVLPRKEFSWVAYHTEEEKIPHLERWEELSKTSKSYNLNPSVVQSLNMTHVFCFGCILQFYYGYDNILLFSLISWLLALSLIYLLWWRRTRRWEPEISTVGSSQKLERSYTSEWKTLSTWLSIRDKFPQSGDDDSKASFETNKEELGASSRFQRKLDKKPEPEIVPAED